MSVAIACVGALAACGSSGANAHHSRHTTPKPHSHPRVAVGHPVYQLPPGHFTLASARTPSGPVAITLHRIRYFGHVSLCVSASDTRGATTQSCANYPVGPRSNQGIGDSPVWWATTYLDLCAKPRFEVVAGVLLRHGLTAWLSTPAGVVRMPYAAIPKAFGVAGGLIYATIATEPDRVTLRGPAGSVIYSAPVERLAELPRVGCSGGTLSAGPSTTMATTSGAVLQEHGQYLVP